MTEQREGLGRHRWSWWRHVGGSRPRVGWVHRRGGAVERVRFREGDEVGVFVPVNRAGADVVILQGESLDVDVLGPNQSVQVELIDDDVAP